MPGLQRMWTTWASPETFLLLWEASIPHSTFRRLRNTSALSSSPARVSRGHLPVLLALMQNQVFPWSSGSVKVSIVFLTASIPGCTHWPCTASQSSRIAKETKEATSGFTGNHMAFHQIAGKTRRQKLLKCAQDLTLVLILGSSLKVFLFNFLH